jgi:hypothetical protein
VATSSIPLSLMEERRGSNECLLFGLTRADE